MFSIVEIHPHKSKSFYQLRNIYKTVLKEYISTSSEIYLRKSFYQFRNISVSFYGIHV
jgi:hypothetical protein